MPSFNEFCGTHALQLPSVPRLARQLWLLINRPYFGEATLVAAAAPA
jgi:hypothetical protein